MKDVLTVKGLTKNYQDFTLDHVSFEIPQGSIVGLIGENGAGKSTIIKAVLGLIKKDDGEITLFGRQDGALNKEIKEQIGVVFDGSNFSGDLSPRKLNKVFKDIYRSWDEDLYISLLEKMAVPVNQKIKTFSKGMKMKLSLVAAFAHHPKLLILDEATSGLDPVMRDEILDMFLEFVQDEENSILVSSHITSDLEKVADYIIFVHNGSVIFSKPKDELLENYGIIKCGDAAFERIEKEDRIACRKLDYEWQILVEDRNRIQKKYKEAMVVPATIDEIMLLYVKGENR